MSLKAKRNGIGTEERQVKALIKVIKWILIAVIVIAGIAFYGIPLYSIFVVGRTF